MEFTVSHAPTSMTIVEFIEQVGVMERAPAGTPRHLMGVTEALEGGGGVWHKGTTFLLGDGVYRLNQTLAEVGWDNDRGEAGRSKPVTLVFMP